VKSKKWKDTKMSTKENAARKLSEIMKGKVEMDFCCPCCEGTKLYQMHSEGHRVRVFTDGAYLVEESDAIKPDWLYFCCGDCGFVIVTDSPCPQEVVVKDPIGLLEWLFEEYLDSIKQAAYEGDQFPIAD